MATSGAAVFFPWALVFMGSMRKLTFPFPYPPHCTEEVSVLIC